MPNKSQVATPVGVDPDWRSNTVIDVPLAGRILGDLCKNSAYAAVRRGSIPSIRVGARVMVPVVPLRRLIGELPELPMVDDQVGDAS